MFKNMVTAILMSTIAGQVFANALRPSKSVNLSVAGAMEQIRKSNPAHYKKVQSISSGLASRSDAPVRQWMRTKFQAKDVFFSNIFLTSSPAQRDISFVLDDTRYYGRVMSTPGGGQVFLIRYR